MSQSPFARSGAGYEFELPGESEGEYEFENEQESLEAELAGELLEISSEAELEQFLGKLARSVMKGASAFVKSPIGKALGGVLKNVAKTALPAVGGALGSLVLPGAGTAIGAKLGSMAGGLLEVGEAEAMGEAEAEYEAAQRYVRFARSAWGNAASAPSHLPPRAVVRAASVSAARRYAPSLLRGPLLSPWRQRRRPRSRPGWYVEPRYRTAWSDDGWSGGTTYDGAGDGDWDDGSDGGPFEVAQGAPTSHRSTEGRWVRGRRGNIVLLGV